MSLISRDPQIRGGAYCIRGTRISVSGIKSCVPEWDHATIMREFPGLTVEQIDAALAFRSRPVRGGV